MPLIIPFHPENATATIVIDGVTYRVPLVDSDGHLQVDVLTGALPSDAATAANQATMITALQLIDDLRAALDAVRTDRLNVNLYRDGASEVKGALLRSVDDSTTRATVVAPTSGKKIRLITCQIATSHATAHRTEVYFGTGVNITTNAGKEIANPVLQADVFGPELVPWPDGAGPVGDVDEVVSLRTSVNIATAEGVVVHYREE